MANFQKIIVVLRTLNAFLRTQIGAYVKPKRYDQIFQQIENIRPKRIMEVGVWKGSRSKVMIETAAKYWTPGEIEYFGFDLFETMDKDVYTHEVSKMPPKEADIRSFLESLGARINLFAGYTQDTMKTIDQLPKVDFVFIDGGHATETVRNDWEGVQKVMHKNTVVIFDDYWHNRKDGPRVVVDSIDRNIFNVEILPIVDVFFNPDFGRMVISLAKVTLK